MRGLSLRSTFLAFFSRKYESEFIVDPTHTLKSDPTLLASQLQIRHILQCYWEEKAPFFLEAIKRDLNNDRKFAFLVLRLV